MQGPKPPTFRPTLALWTPNPRQLPAVAVCELQVEDGAVITVDLPRWAPIPEDFVLREVLDADQASVVEFMATYGVLGMSEGALITLPDNDPPLYRRSSSFLAPVPRGIHLDVAQHKLRVLRALAKVVLADADRDQAGVIDAWPSEGFNRPRQSDPADQARTAWRWWTDHVNAALRAFPLYVEFDAPGSGGHELGSIRRPTLYEVAILQLVQIATEGRDIGRCANIRCGRPFTRQRTVRRRYQGAEHASGVKYCSRLCAKAQSERDRRSRRRP